MTCVVSFRGAIHVKNTFPSHLIGLLQKETMELTKRLDHITWKSEMMEKKMADMESSSQMMNKVIATTQENINDLK